MKLKIFIVCFFIMLPINVTAIEKYEIKNALNKFSYKDWNIISISDITGYSVYCTYAIQLEKSKKRALIKIRRKKNFIYGYGKWALLDEKVFYFKDD